MKKKTIKAISLILMAILTIAVLSQGVFATDESSDSYNLNQFTGQGNNAAESSVKNVIGAIISLAQIIGTGVAIIMLIVLEIKYISAAPGDKADIKKHAVVYIVGAVVLFAATGILEIIKNFASNVG